MRTDRCGNTCGQECHAKGSRKEIKHKSLCIEIQRMWDVKYMIIPVIIGATGIVKSFTEKFGSRTRNIFNRLTTKDVQCATGFNIKTLYVLRAQCISPYVFSISSEQRAIISLHSTHCLVFIFDKENLYCAVRTEYLNLIQLNFCLEAVKDLRLI